MSVALRTKPDNNNPPPSSPSRLRPYGIPARLQTYNVVQNIQDVGRLSYDGRNKRIFQSDVVTSMVPGKKFYETIALYEQNVQYRWDKSQKQCTKTALPPNSWRDLGVPFNATFKVQVELGSIGDGFTANEFELYCSDPESGACMPHFALDHLHADPYRRSAAAASDCFGHAAAECGEKNVPYYQQGRSKTPLSNREFAREH